MINVACRSGSIAPYLKGTTQAVANTTKPLAAAVVIPKESSVSPAPMAISSKTLARLMPKGTISVVSGPAVQTQVRFAHTDLQVPDFSAYRRDSTKNPSRKSTTVEDRKAFTYMLVGGTTVVATYGAKSIVTQFISSMSATADVLALAKIEVKLGDIPEGKSVTFKWRGKPLFIRHRTADEIAAERSVPMNELRDPQPDSDRAQRPEWLVVLGVCTHLGCVPIANAGDYGGYYCPCHGSHYDAAGRIRKGPAPLNLEVPPYEYTEEGTLVVG